MEEISAENSIAENKTKLDGVVTRITKMADNLEKVITSLPQAMAECVQHAVKNIYENKNVPSSKTPTTPKIQ